jgi:uncharacterized protein YfaQ (DUF2300 family)
MDIELAEARLSAQSANLKQLLEQRQFMASVHQGERLYPFLAPFYPESLKWTGRAALATAVAVKEMVITAPTIISNRIKGNN